MLVWTWIDAFYSFDPTLFLPYLTILWELFSYKYQIDYHQDPPCFKNLWILVFIQFFLRFLNIFLDICMYLFIFLYLPFCYFHENTSFFFSTKCLNIFTSGWCAFIHTPLPLHYTLNLGYVTLLFYFIFFVLATKKLHTTCFSHIIFPITSSSLF